MNRMTEGIKLLNQIADSELGKPKRTRRNFGRCYHKFDVKTSSKTWRRCSKCGAHRNNITNNVYLTNRR